MMKDLIEAIRYVEQSAGVSVTGDVVVDVLMYTIRKCKCISKDPSYIPLLFKTELIDFYTREAINRISENVSASVGGAL